MSSELHKYIETAIDKKENLFNAEIIKFTNEKKLTNSQSLTSNDNSFWKLYDKSSAKEDGDQLKAVIGICFMISTLIIMGLYSNFL
mgnify:CR=1 FL=1|tara:strand:+ start:904 stop:1161 length:258 start_codon:yes stop_codon:yes gene_type:complete